MIQIDHKKYQQKVKKMSMAELMFTIEDCKQTIAIMPNGEKSGYYADEIHYCAMEIKKRQRK